VTFAPTASGTQAGTLTVVSDAPGEPTVVALAGVGVAAPVVSTSVGALTITVAPGSTANGSLTLTNAAEAGAAPLTWAATVEGAPAGVLSAAPDAGTLDAGQAQEITLTADASGLAEGTTLTYTLRLATNDPVTPELTVDVTVVTQTVSAGDGAAPLAFSLGQNYPNPFAGRTRVAFDLPEATSVTLAVYDVAGRRVATLVDAELPAGSHTAEWDASGLAAGVYVYRIQAGAFVQTLRALVVE